MKSYPPLLTAKQAAELAQVSDKHIRDLCAEGAFKAVKVGELWRINTESYLTYLGLEGEVCWAW